MLECSMGIMGISLFTASYGKKQWGGRELLRTGLNAIGLPLPSLTELPPDPAAYLRVVGGKSNFNFIFQFFSHKSDPDLERLQWVGREEASAPPLTHYPLHLPFYPPGLPVPSHASKAPQCHTPNFQLVPSNL